jgi:hypothetical protein
MPFHDRSHVPAHVEVSVSWYVPFVSGVQVTDGASCEPHDVLDSVMPADPVALQPTYTNDT